MEDSFTPEDIVAREREKSMDRVFPLNRAPGYSVEFGENINQDMVAEVVDLVNEFSEERKAIAQIVQKGGLRVEGLILDPSLLDRLIRLSEERPELKISLSIASYEDEQYATVCDDVVGIAGESLFTLNRISGEEKGQRDPAHFFDVWRMQGVGDGNGDKYRSFEKRRQMIDLDTFKAMNIWPSSEQISELPDIVFRGHNKEEIKTEVIDGKDWDLIVLDMNRYTRFYEEFKGNDKKVFMASSLKTLTDIRAWMVEAAEDVYTVDATSESVSLLFPSGKNIRSGERLPAAEVLETIIKNFTGIADDDTPGKEKRVTSRQFTNVNPELEGEHTIYKVGNRVLAIYPPVKPEDIYQLELRHKELGLPEYKTIRSGD